MGDAKAGPVRLSFNPQLRVEFHGAAVTSDAAVAPRAGVFVDKGRSGYETTTRIVGDDWSNI